MLGTKWIIIFFISTIIFYFYDFRIVMHDIKLMHASKIQLQNEIYEKNNKISKKSSHKKISFINLHHNELITFFIKHGAENGMAIHAIDYMGQSKKLPLHTMIFKLVLLGNNYLSFINFIDHIINDKYLLNIEEVDIHPVNDVTIEFRIRIVVTNVLSK